VGVPELGRVADNLGDSEGLSQCPVGVPLPPGNRDLPSKAALDQILAGPSSGDDLQTLVSPLSVSFSGAVAAPPQLRQTRGLSGRRGELTRSLTARHVECCRSHLERTEQVKARGAVGTDFLQVVHDRRDMQDGHGPAGWPLGADEARYSRPGLLLTVSLPSECLGTSLPCSWQGCPRRQSPGTPGSVPGGARLRDGESMS
jgi:hypothetical protein